MNLIEEIELNNGLTLSIYDLSRHIADDTVKVEILIKTQISLKENYFTIREDYLQVKNVFGKKVAFEYKKERSFIPIEKRIETRDELVETFKNNSLNYVASDNFPHNLALSKLRDIRNNPYKYKNRESET